MNILFVDDDPVILETYADEVANAIPEVTVHTSTSGEKAIECCADEDFSLVFTDIMMPKMNGIELASKLRKAHPKLTVIAITGYSREHTAESITASGINHLLEKPIDYDILLDMIRDHVANHDKKNKSDE